MALRKIAGLYRIEKFIRDVLWKKYGNGDNGIPADSERPVCPA